MSQDQQLDKSIKEAATIAKDPRAVEILADKAQNKTRKNERIFKNIYKDVGTLIRLARAWAGGKYKDVGAGSILIIVGAIIYLIDPFDVIPDFIPLIGLTDDAALIGLAITRVRKELEKFEDWESVITLK